MSIAKSLSAEQITQIQAWADEGDGISEIQKKLRDDLEMRVTYLETRFLLEDLKIELKPTQVPEPEPEPETETGAGETEAQADAGLDHDAAGEGPENVGVKVTLDAVLRPGAIISGKADFGGGNISSWWLDQSGRLGMDPGDPAFRPSEEQLIAFQSELRAVIQKSGF